MEKLKMHSPNLTENNIDRIRELFPNCITEGKDEGGKIKYAVDFDLLKQELSGQIVEGSQERYQLNWPGKKEALLTANAPIAKTLRPCVEESVDFDNTKNLFIEGDNLDALKLLQETYLGKVKLMYFDPPYNTGSDFVYEDDFAENPTDFLIRSNQVDAVGNRLIANTESNGRFHSDWLTMIFPRLKLARNLLREDGVVFISIDDHEVDNLKKVCNEIFGEKNFIANIVWQRAFSPKNDAKFLSENHDYLLVYAKNSDQYVAGRLDRTQEANARYENSDNDPRGEWVSGDLTVKTYSEKYDYPITTPSGRTVKPSHGSCWRVSKEKLQELIKDKRIWFGANGDNVPRLKRFLTEVQDGMVATTLWLHQEVGHNQEGRQELKDLFDGKGYFDGPKPVRLLSRVLKIGNISKDDIFLDFFAGSSSSAHAVIKYNADEGHNCRFIMVQKDEPCDESSEAFKAGYKTIADISKERIRRAGSKIKEEQEKKQQHEKDQPSLLDDPDEKPKAPQNLDIGFRVLKVDTSNMADVFYTPDALKSPEMYDAIENIKLGRANEDLLFQALLDWNVPLSLPIRKERISRKDEKGKKAKKSSNDDFEVFFVDENALVACFDDNISEALVRELANRKPLRVVFKDNGFESDTVKINTEQIFKQLSPNTVVKSI
jgi:adenine-specific DNA-methyltransferase